MPNKKVSCPSQYPILLLSTYCVSQCSLGFEQSSEDVFECVSQSQCPTYFTPKQGSNVVCMKPTPSPLTYGQKCAQGYEEWTENLCFQNCPQPLLENGTSCLKPTLTRDYVPFPTDCEGIFRTSSSSTGCKVSAIGICIIIVLFIGIIWLLWIFCKLFKSNFSKEPLDVAITQIDKYFEEQTQKLTKLI